MNMRTLNIPLLFFIFEFTCFVKSQKPKELYEREITNEENAAKLLHKLEPGHALPLVLFKNNYYKNVFLPWNFLKVNSLDGKMIQGTEFTSRWEGKEQMFFCPKSNEEKCLVETSFDEREVLECASEPIPVSEPENEKCGKEETGSLHNFVYQICEGQYEIRTKVIQLYRYCYDENREQTLFIIHTIQSPALLTAKLLLREREMTYPIIMNDGTLISIKKGLDGMEEYDPPLSSPKLDYRWKELVQTKDMALALWKKPFFRGINLALQHKSLIEIWDNIGDYVRSNAIQSVEDKKLLTVVVTGVFDLKSKSEIKNGDQLFNIWVKLIMKKTSPTNYTSYIKEGVAVLMNNFIDTDTSLPSNLNPDGIETFCEQDICTESLKDQFKKVKGNVRCCLVTNKILDLFGHEHISVKESYISKINLGEDQEILQDEENNGTEEQPVESLREIQSHEILPIILYLYEDQDVFELQYPLKIQQIITKNKRMVNGSQFSPGSIEEQLLFCPKEDPNEACLVPRKFDRFEPLQCTKLPVPKITKALTPSDKEIRCGVHNKGILYDVVYEFCTDVPLAYKFKDSNIKIYQFCYDPNKQRILYTRHEPSSKYLLNSKLLFWERKVEFLMPTDTPLPLSNLKQIQDALKKETDKSTSPTDTNQPVYKLQKLVPSEDMPFASWKIPTNLLVNLAFQHESLISFWKEINRKVRKIGSINVAIYNGERSGVWFKIIQKKMVFRNRNDEVIVILMQNYLTRYTDRSVPSNSEENTLKQYCDTDVCLEEFRNKFNKIGGQVRCCRLTTKIIQTFGIKELEKETSTLRIPDIIIDFEHDDSY